MSAATSDRSPRVSASSKNSPTVSEESSCRRSTQSRPCSCQIRRRPRPKTTRAALTENRGVRRRYKIDLLEALDLIALEPIGHRELAAELSAFCCSERTAEDAITILGRGRYVETKAAPDRADRRGSSRCAGASTGSARGGHYLATTETAASFLRPHVGCSPRRLAKDTPLPAADRGCMDLESELRLVEKASGARRDLPTHVRRTVSPSAFGRLAGPGRGRAAGRGTPASCSRAAPRPAPDETKHSLRAASQRLSFGVAATCCSIWSATRMAHRLAATPSATDAPSPEVELAVRLASELDDES